MSADPHLDPSGVDTTDAGLQDRQFVTFSVSGEMFAVPMAPVQEIIRVPDVARLPLAPSSLAGLANLRGRVLPIVNLRSIFQTEARDHDDATRALVIDLGQPLGFVVDRVASVITLEPGEMESAAAVQSVAQTDYLTGVIRREQPDGSHQLLLALNFERLIEVAFAQLRERSQAADTHHRAQLEDGSTASEPTTVDELRLVSFTVEGQEYALDIADVQEIVQVPERITALPNTASHCLGVISLRQRLLPLVSLRGLFHLPPVALDEHHRIVVVSLPGRGPVGLVTDAVKEVLSVPRSQTETMPAVLARGHDLQEFSSICRLEGGKRLVSIIDSDRLLGLPAIQQALLAGAADDSHPHTEANAMTDHPTATTPTDDDAQVVIFRLGAEEFGVPIMSVQEIVRVPDVLTRIPKTPSFVEGVINLRGTVLPVIDQRVRLGMPAIERSDRQRIMVYTLGGLRTGFIVDSVAEVLRIPRPQIERSPELSQEQSRLITQVAKLDGDKRLVMLIEPSQLLGGGEMGDLRSALQPGAAPIAASLALPTDERLAA